MGYSIKAQEPRLGQPEAQVGVAQSRPSLAEVSFGGSISRDRRPQPLVEAVQVSLENLTQRAGELLGITNVPGSDHQADERLFVFSNNRGGVDFVVKTGGLYLEAVPGGSYHEELAIHATAQRSKLKQAA